MVWGAEGDAPRRVRVQAAPPWPSPTLLLPALSPPAVTIRLLDPPLHEFLPHEGTPELDALCDGLAKEMAGRSGQHMNAVRILKNKIHGLQESNPMLGLRGCRLGIRHPGARRRAGRGGGRGAAT